MMTMNLDRKSFRDCRRAILRSPGRATSTAVAATLATAIVCGLLAAPQRASAQSNDCVRLNPWASVFEGAVAYDRQRPQNVSANFLFDSRRGSGFNVRWDIASEFPRSVLTGRCVEVSHPVSGYSETHCSTENPTATYVNEVYSCFRTRGVSGYACPRGSFNIRVRLTVNCNKNDLPWSNSVSATKN